MCKFYDWDGNEITDIRAFLEKEGPKILNLLEPMESVSEMITRLTLEKEGKEVPNNISDKLINETLSPKGELSSYHTQKTIHYNTYSGVALTGIAANASKIIAYLYNIIGKETLPTFKKSRWITYGNTTYDGIKRFEVSPETGQEVITPYSKKVKVFATLDTIVNLAIDNVKEGKLHLLGITNANSNAFLTAISMGIPLNDVVLLFRSPIVSRISSSRFDASKILNSLMAAYQKEYGEYENIALDKETLELYFKDKLNEKDTKQIEIAIMEIMAKLASVGEEYFANSNIVSMLRGFPGTKAGMDYINSRVDEYYENDSMESNEKAASALFNRYLNSSNLTDEEKAKLKNDGAYKSRIFYLSRSGYLNSLMRKSDKANFIPKEKSSFKEGSIMNLPHVKESWRILNKLSRFIEEAFPIYSAAMADFTKMLKSRSMLYFNTFGEDKAFDFISKEFFKFVSSTLTMTYKGDVIDLKASGSKYQLLSEEESWAQEFIERLGALKKTSDNQLIKHLEISSKDQGQRSILFTSDKLSDDELKYILKDGYIQLLDSEKEFAYDLFKYAVVTQGLAYGRTNLSEIFPPSMKAAFSNALEQRLRESLTNQSLNERAKTLNNLANLFELQLVINNSDKISFLSYLNPIATKISRNAKDYQVFVNGGKDSGVTFFVKSIIQDSAKQTITKVQESDVEAKVKELEKNGLLEIDCKGKIKAEKGLQTNFTKGGKWKIYEIFEGKSHKQGGIDINIKNNQISFTNKNGSVKAKYGLVISKDN